MGILRRRRLQEADDSEGAADALAGWTVVLSAPGLSTEV